MGEMADLYDYWLDGEGHPEFEHVVHPVPAPKKCRYCKSKVFFVNNREVYGKPVGQWPMIYLCRNCGARVGTHPRTPVPLGCLADTELRIARVLSKSAFQSMLKVKHWGRGKGYRWLSLEMPCPAEQCHFGMFELEQCRRVSELCDVFRGEEIASELRDL